MMMFNLILLKSCFSTIPRLVVSCKKEEKIPFPIKFTEIKVKLKCFSYRFILLIGLAANFDRYAAGQVLNALY